MCKCDYDTVDIGTIVKISKKVSINYERLGKVVYKRNHYVCIEPLEGEPDFSNSNMSPNNQALIACNYASLELA